MAMRRAARIHHRRQRRREVRLVRGRAHRALDRGGELATVGVLLEPFQPVAAGEQGGQLHEHRRAVALAGPDRERGARRQGHGEAHHRLIHRADLLHVERPVRQPLAAQHHELIQHAQQAAVADRRDARRVGGCLLAQQEREGRGIEQLAAAPAHPAGAAAAMHEAEQRQQATPGAAPLVHRVRRARLVVQQLGVQRAHAVALVVEGAALGVGARGHQVAILGIEQEHEAHQHREQALVEMAGPGARQFGDPLRLGRVQAAQQPVQRAEHLARERRGDGGLRPSALRQQRRQAALRRVGEQPRRTQQQLEAAQQRPARHLPQRVQREGQPARGLATRRRQQPDRVVGDEQPGADAALAQQPFEALVRGRLPARQRAAPVGIDAGRLVPHQELPAGSVRERDGVVRLQQGIALSQVDARGGVERRAARGAGDALSGPAEHFRQRPEAWHAQRARRLGGVDGTLALRHQIEVAQHARRHHDAHGIGMVQPVEVRVGYGHRRRA